MIVAERPPYPMFFVGGIGVIALLSGIGTLAHSFSILLGSAFLAYGIAILLDTFALGYTWWAIDSVMANRPHLRAKLAAHLCVAASVGVQIVTSLSEVRGLQGWALALVRILAPLSLCLVLEMASSHYEDLHRARMAPGRVMEVMREQAARGATGLPVNPKKCAHAVVAAAKANLISIEALTSRIDPDEIAKVPALAALYGVVCTSTDPVRPARQGLTAAPAATSAAATATTPVVAALPNTQPEHPNTSAEHPNTSPVLVPVRQPNTEHAPNVRTAFAEHLPNTEPNTEHPQGVRPNTSPEHPNTQPERPVFAQLSTVEKADRVTALVSQGMSVRAIATALGCSVSTASAWVRKLSTGQHSPTTTVTSPVATERQVGFTLNGGEIR